MGPLSVAWTVGGVAAAFWVANTTERFDLFLLIFALAALGSGAFQPAGDPALGSSSRQAIGVDDRGLLFLCGQLGLTAGPMVAGLLLAWLGPRGIYGLAIAEAPIILFMIWGLRETSRREHLDHHAAVEREATSAKPSSPKAISPSGGDLHSCAAGSSSAPPR